MFMHDERKTKQLSIRRKSLTLSKWNAPYFHSMLAISSRPIIAVGNRPNNSSFTERGNDIFSISLWNYGLDIDILCTAVIVWSTILCTINSLSGVIICHRIFSDEPLSAVDLRQDELVDHHGSPAPLRIRSQLRKHKYLLEWNRAFVCSTIRWQFGGKKEFDEFVLRCPDCEYLHLFIH